MSLLLAPYNNAMRLGQGFNSYTQQMCVDDAVVIDPLRPENVVSNDGTTMRIMAQKEAKPSAWTRQREVITDERATDNIKQKSVMNSVKAAQTPHEVAKIEEAPSKPPSLEKGKPVEIPTEELAESKPTQEDVETGEVDAGDQADAETSDAPAAIVKQPESSASEAEAEKGVEKSAGSDEDNSGNIDGQAKPKSPSTAAPSAPKPSLSAAATKRGLIRSSSVDAVKTSKPSKPDVIPQHTAKISPTTQKSSASEDLKEDPADVIARRKEEQATLATQRAYQKQLEKELREEEFARRKEERDEQRAIRKEKREFDAVRRKEAREAISDAAKLKAMSMADLQKIIAQNQFVDRFSGMGENQQDYVFDSSGSRGPSQIVTYSSRFVDRLSDVTEDMCVSGSLSIKAAKLGGSGKGSFVDSDKFKESDLNFYISVKVINHTVNFKDALVYNPLRSVDETDSKTFRKVYGDTFISGFIEGGEFNAIVSMKILNKAKKTDIQAEAKVAFTAGPVDITAEANVGIARSNIETNTETTIQVSWAGGGHIKPMDQQWDIKSLMQAASRFPDLVADCPQRTYAILTKYETLRSFIARQPAAFSPLQYENAQIYTNMLLDSFMSYKAMYKRLGEQIFNVQGKTMEILPRGKKDIDSPEGSQVVVAGTKAATSVSSGSKNTQSGHYPFVDDMTPFEASLKGLSDARISIRRQMTRIVNEVTLIEGDPKVATDEDHHEPFQSPVAFEVRLPEVGIPQRLKKASQPLTGKRIIAKTQTEQELKDSVDEQEQLENLPPPYTASEDISTDERSALDKVKDQRPTIGTNLRVTAPAGSLTNGTPFNNLDFLQPDWNLTKVRIEIAKGAVVAFWLHYDNGLIISRGKTRNSMTVEMCEFAMGERIIAATVHTGKGRDDKEEARVISLNLYTNRGRCILGQADTCIYQGEKKHLRDGALYRDVAIKSFDSPLKDGNLKGFWGRSDDTAIWRLGLIWGDINKDADKAVESVDVIAEDPITAAKAEMATLRSQTEAAMTKAKAENAALRLQSEASKEEGRRSEQRALWAHRPSSWRNGLVQIFHILYNGQPITTDAVAERLLYKAQYQETFQCTLSLFGLDRDPAPGVLKLAYILYRYNDTGPLRVLAAHDNHMMNFDPLPS